jgi:hypothetical protein
MKKLITLVALASFNTLATDLSTSNNYYCKMVAYTQIYEGKAKVLKPLGFTVKVTAEGSVPYVTILQAKHSESLLFSLSLGSNFIIANDNALTFRMTRDGDDSGLPFMYHKFAYNKPGHSAGNIMQQMSSGICYLI